MADYSGLGKGASYQEIITGGQRYGAMTRDAFDPIAASSMRQVGPRPISVVSHANYMDVGAESSGALSAGKSILPWVIGGLAVGLIWIHLVHF